MIVKRIPFSWIAEEEHRLDCGPFTRGGIEAKKRLEASSLQKEDLIDLTTGGATGMYHVGMDKLRWVDGRDYGVPFLRSSDILKADLSSQPLISREQAEANPLFRCPAGSTLITRSGSIGRMAYCRQDMADMAMSQDVLKVVPDSSRVPPGYLYAFLSSRFGVPLVVSGTFGSIIVHIEAENIARLPVPRLGPQVEEQVHALVQGAAAARSKAVGLLEKARQRVRGMLPVHAGPSPSLWTSVHSSRLQPRLDAFYFSAPCIAARRAFDGAAVAEHRKLGDVARVFIPGIFKRRYADPEYGIPYLTGNDVFQLAPTSDRYLMRSVAEQFDLVVSQGDILIQEAGQIGGLIGRSVLVGSYLDGFAISNNMIRLTPHEASDSGYISAVLSTSEGVLLISRESAGSSIPHIDESRVRNIRIPWPPAAERRTIGDDVIRAQELRDQACVDESRARMLVEDAIEAAS
ncbi:restriction endonuclease subunit S [Micromonospora polyrhachis]|uniref:Type I restriction enzyme S subunit n=1 Tax=Micromonospora polyrhachis TaxID=1282883 RepID=A0A7W7SP11_9ACTN|nr:restriction endonuclease subunit S [Micromonospora polyrhachis]MBB4957732.1 type I restriction enzyme S subunit [Micromonospora polyrhachis]